MHILHMHKHAHISPSLGTFDSYLTHTVSESNIQKLLEIHVCDDVQFTCSLYCMSCVCMFLLCHVDLRFVIPIICMHALWITFMFQRQFVGSGLSTYPKPPISIKKTVGR
jgi:hypothetical protein